MLLVEQRVLAIELREEYKELPEKNGIARSSKISNTHLNPILDGNEFKRVESITLHFHVRVKVIHLESTF